MALHIFPMSEAQAVYEKFLYPMLLEAKFLAKSATQKISQLREMAISALEFGFSVRVGNGHRPKGRGMWGFWGIFSHRVSNR
jgi:hypothetical protein